jgi:hypothetical protein
MRIWSWYLRFAKYDVPCMSVSFSCLLLFVSLFFGVDEMFSGGYRNVEAQCLLETILKELKYGTYPRMLCRM